MCCGSNPNPNPHLSTYYLTSSRSATVVPLCVARYSRHAGVSDTISRLQAVFPTLDCPRFLDDEVTRLIRVGVTG